MRQVARARLVDLTGAAHDRPEPVAFDLDGSGGVVYTDGRSIFHIDAKGKREKLCSPDHVDRVIVLD